MAVQLNQEVAPPDFLSSDPSGKIPRKVITRVFSKNDLEQQKNEIELLKRDSDDKERQISILNKRVEEYTDTCNSLHSLICMIEEACGEQFFSPEQRNKTIIITQMEYARIIRNSLNTLIEIHKGLPDRFTADFSKRATAYSDKLVEIRDKIIEVRQKQEKTREEVKRMKRLAAINLKEKESLLKIVQSIEAETERVDKQSQLTIDQIKDNTQKIKTEIRTVKKETINAQKAVYKAQNEPPKRVYDTSHDDVLLEREIKELSKRLESEQNSRLAAISELEHVNQEIERGKQHIARHRSALGKEALAKAEAVNRDLRAYIEERREADARAYSAQLKKNKDLERQLVELREEAAMLKPYLAQLERKYQQQMTRLPSLAPSKAEPSSPVKALQHHRGDDAEMKSVKRAMSNISKRKAASKLAATPKGRISVF